MFDPAVPLVPEGAVSSGERRALEGGVVTFRRTDVTRFSLTGPGRVACVQGLVTCDIERAGDGAHLFGALLTVKGMVVTPLWITRLVDEILVEAPDAGGARVRETFTRSLPPRLCRSTDISAETASVGIYGAGADAMIASVLRGGPLPPAAGAVTATVAGRQLVVARAVARGAPGFDCVVPAAHAAALQDELASRGAVPASPALLEECRILAGIPRLGAEIDDKTLPQEARLDELGAVSYTKGCYLGQETVARLHFRGHANRALASVVLERGPAGPLPLALSLDGKPVGRLTSVAWSEVMEGHVGVAVIRREVADGADVELPDGSHGVVHGAKWLGTP